MKKIFILLTSMFLLVGCVESIAILGGGATNGKLVQSSFKSGASLGIKKQTGKTPLEHALNLIGNNERQKIKIKCSSFAKKKEIEICLMTEKKITSNKLKIKEKNSLANPSIETVLSLLSSINKKSKIKYLD